MDWTVDIHKGQSCVRYQPPMQRLASGVSGWLEGFSDLGIAQEYCWKNRRNSLFDVYVTQGCSVIQLKVQKAVSWQGRLERGNSVLGWWTAPADITI